MERTIPATTPLPGEVSHEPRPLAQFWRDLRASRKGSIGAAIVLLMLLVAIGVPLLPIPDPTAQDAGAKFTPAAVLGGGDWSHPFGTDNLGRDVLSRVLWGARVSVAAGVLVVLVASILGSLLGAVAGYFGGWLDALIMRVVDIQLSFPFIVLAIIFVAIFGRGFLNIVIALAVALWVNYARLVRAETLKIRELEYVQAARGIGVPPLAIVREHVLPNVLPSILVLATLDVSWVIIYESSLSYLSLGIQPPTPTWGGMLYEGRNYLQEAVWMTIFPAVAIVTASLGINLFGDFLRDTIDPTLVRA